MYNFHIEFDHFWLWETVSEHTNNHWSWVFSLKIDRQKENVNDLFNSWIDTTDSWIELNWIRLGEKTMKMKSV